MNRMGHQLDQKPAPQKQQKRAVFRTVAILLVVVLGIYLFFIGRAFFNYPGV